MPIAWLQEGEILSHVAHLDLGTIWDQSVVQADWRQEPCIQEPVLFYSDVTGQQASRLPLLQRYMAYQKDTTTTYAIHNLTQFFASNRIDLALADRYLQERSQLVSVQQICKNSDFKAVLLMLWGIFGGSCLLVVCMYAVAYKLATRAGPTYFGLKSFLSPLWALSIVVTKGCSGLGGLAFYWYDCITHVIVLCQVRHTWPGHLLAIIFFFHFATVGAILACHMVHRLVAPVVGNKKLVLYLMWDMLAVVMSPVMIPVVILLDTTNFVIYQASCTLAWTEMAAARLRDCIQVAWVCPCV